MQNDNSRKILVNYDALVMELHPGISYYLGGNSDLSIKYARIDRKKIGHDAQKIIIPSKEVQLLDNPIKVIVEEDGTLKLCSIFDDGTVTAGEQSITQQGVIIDQDCSVSALGDALFEISFKDHDFEIPKNLTETEQEAWSEATSEAFVERCSKISNIITFFDLLYEYVSQCVSNDSVVTIFQPGELFHEHLQERQSELANGNLDALSEIEKDIHIYAGQENYVTAHIIDAVQNIEKKRADSAITHYRNSSNGGDFVCFPLFLSDSVFVYLIIEISSSDADMSFMQDISDIVSLAEGELFQAVARDPTTRARIGNYERGISFLDEVNSTIMGRVSRSRTWSKQYNHMTLASQRDIFISKKRNMRFYRRIGDMYFYLTYASAHKSGKIWVSHEIASSTLQFMQDSFQYLMFAILSELESPDTLLTLPMQYRASIARSDSTEENGRMRMDFVGTNTDQDFIGEPLNILSIIEQYAQPFSIMMHRWVARDLAPRMIGVLGGHAGTHKFSYDIEHRVSLISLLGLKRLEDERIIDSVLRVWVQDVAAYAERPLPGMVDVIYLSGARGPNGMQVPSGQMHFSAILPIDLSEMTELTLEFREPLLYCKEQYSCTLLGVEKVYNEYNLGNGMKKYVVSYRHMFALASNAEPTASEGAQSPTVSNIFVRMMQGTMIGSQDEFKYFFNSLRLRDLPLPREYTTVEDALFTKGEANKKDWDLIWEPVLRKKYEPILTNEFGVYF